MNYKIDIKKEDMLALVTDTSLDTLIKPLINKIHLFDTYIAGTTYVKDKIVLDEISVNEELVLIREDNKFDDMAIAIYNQQKQKIGYIPQKDNIIFSRLMDAGKKLIAVINKIEDKKYMKEITIRIYLVDY